MSTMNNNSEHSYSDGCASRSKYREPVFISEDGVGFTNIENCSDLHRQVDAGYRKFWAKRGYSEPPLV